MSQDCQAEEQAEAYEEEAAVYEDYEEEEIEVDEDEHEEVVEELPEEAA